MMSANYFDIPLHKRIFQNGALSYSTESLRVSRVCEMVLIPIKKRL
jgi:hypothetical protein